MELEQKTVNQYYFQTLLNQLTKHLLYNRNFSWYYSFSNSASYARISKHKHIQFFSNPEENQMKQRGSTCEIVGDKCSAPIEQRPILPNLAGERE